MSRLQLYVLPGSKEHDLPSLHPESLVAASYLQLLRPGEWDIIESGESGALPLLKDGPTSFTGSAILSHLVRTSKIKPALNPLAASEAVAFQALLDTTVLPLVLHSLASLPKNWVYIRKLFASTMPYPTRLYRPEQLREAAREVVEATHPAWWGLGGEAEKEEELQKRRQKALLDGGIDGVRERKEEERKQSKERVRSTFGEGKIVAAAREVFGALEQTLAASSTPFFFSSPTSTPLDAHLSSLLSLVLYLALPVPLLADLINASFPRLWAHTALLRRTLWSDPPSRPAPIAHSWSWSATLHDLVPMPWEWDTFKALGFGKGDTVKGKVVATKKEQEFARKRLLFFGVVAVGVVGWGLGTGAIPLPGRLGRVWDDEEEGEWVEVDDEDDEIDE